MTINDLKFRHPEITECGPVMTCCNCGSKAKISNKSLIADFAIYDGHHFTFFLCSLDCCASFHLINKRYIVNKFINDRIEQTKELIRKHII